MRHNTHTVLILVLLTVIAAVFSGCASVQESLAAVTDARNDASQMKLAVDEELASLTDQRAATENPEAASALDAAISRLALKSAALSAAITHADQTIENVESPSDPLTLGVKAITPFVPAPFQAPLVLGAALAATLVRSGALKRSTSSIIESIDHAKRKDADFKAAMDRNADAIRSIQTPSARKLVQKSSS